MLLFLGDTHGTYDIDLFFLSLNRFDLRDCTVIHVGDFGMGFDGFNKKTKFVDLFKLNELLSQRNIKMHVCRGNHDDPSYFNNANKNKKINEQLSNIQLHADYTSIKYNDIDIIFLGGSISIDRRQRKVDYSYWLDEGFVYNKKKAAKLLSDIGNNVIVVAHDIPPNQEFDILFSLSNFNDYSLINDIVEHKNDLDKIKSLLLANNKNIIKWIYGHYHTSFTNGFYRCLNIAELFELKV